MANIYYIAETASTNVLLWDMLRKEDLPEGFVVNTGFQTAGKGQLGNAWEAERDMNLLFSILFFPNHLPFDQLFYISQVVSVALKNILSKYTNGISVKWPNDIYWNDKKLGGILIENSLQANKVKTVVGVGLNINQAKFVSDAPNPVSLKQITGESYDCGELLKDMVEEILSLYRSNDVESVRKIYADSLYRRLGYYSYMADNEVFEARIENVHPDGQLELLTVEGQRRTYYFKEVQYK